MKSMGVGVTITAAQTCERGIAPAFTARQTSTKRTVASRDDANELENVRRYFDLYQSIRPHILTWIESRMRTLDKSSNAEMMPSAVIFMEHAANRASLSSRYS